MIIILSRILKEIAGEYRMPINKEKYLLRKIKIKGKTG